MKPIKPNEVIDPELPNIVIVAVNDLIKSNWTGKEARFLLEEIISITGINWMKFDELEYISKIINSYRNSGWIVEYNTPDRDEQFKSNFIFKKKMKGNPNDRN